MDYCILAGGLSRRMGRDKAFLTLGDKYILEILIERFTCAGEKVYLSSARGDVGQRLIHLENKPEEVKDRVVQAGPAGGIYSLLSALDKDIFVIAADMPFADVGLARRLLDLGGAGRDDRPDMIILKRRDGRGEMLFGYYGINCLRPLENMLAEKNYKLLNLAQKVRCVYISEDQMIEACGPDCSRGLFNMNTPDDYRKALEIFEASCECPTGMKFLK